MSQLTNPLQQLLDAASKKAASTQAADTLSRHSFKKQHSGKQFILADISGSMGEMVGTKTKYELLLQALRDNSIDYNKQQLIAFNSFAQEASINNFPTPAGNTALHIAIQLIAQYKPAHTLLITDGQPDDKAEALKAADNLTGVIDVLFIGNENDLEAILFLKKLAARSGGTTTVRDLKIHKTLPSSLIKGLLP